MGVPVPSQDSQLNLMIFEERQVYGRVLFYPMDALGKEYAEYIHRKTLSVTDLRMLKRLGVPFRVVPTQTQVRRELGMMSSEPISRKDLEATQDIVLTPEQQAKIRKL